MVHGNHCWPSPAPILSPSLLQSSAFPRQLDLPRRCRGATLLSQTQHQHTKTNPVLSFLHQTTHRERHITTTATHAHTHTHTHTHNHSDTPTSTYTQREKERENHPTRRRHAPPRRLPHHYHHLARVVSPLSAPRDLLRGTVPRLAPARPPPRRRLLLLLRASAVVPAVRRALGRVFWVWVWRAGVGTGEGTGEGAGEGAGEGEEVAAAVGEGAGEVGEEVSDSGLLMDRGG